MMVVVAYDVSTETPEGEASSSVGGEDMHEIRTACAEQCFRMLGESFRLSGVGARFAEDCQYR